MSREHLLTNTLEWYHKDHPKPGSIAAMDNPWPVLQEQARAHEWNRLQSVAETMALVTLLTAAKVISCQSPITVGKAIYQVGRGSREDRIAAAHCLPGHLMFGSQPLHRLPDWRPDVIENSGLKAMAVALKLRGLFGRTDFVDRSINQADSYLEIMEGGRGLKFQFGHSTEHLMRLVEKNKNPQWNDLQALAYEGVNHYRTHALACYKERLTDLKEKAGLALNEEAAKSIRLKAAIIDVMLGVVSCRQYTPDDVSPCGFPKLVEQVVRIEQHPRIPALS